MRKLDVTTKVGKQVAAYSKKKEALRKRFVTRLSKLRTKCKVQIKNTQNAIHDLQCEEKMLHNTIEEINQAEKQA